MPTYPIRGLSAKGILRDPAPFDLGSDAWSDGCNVYFDGNYVSRAPIFRQVSTGLANTPAFCTGYRPSTGYDYVFTADTQGFLQQYSASGVVSVSPAGFTATPPTGQFTTAFLGDVAYINNPGGVPLWFGPNSTAFASMPAWSPTWSCRVLRAYKDYLVALNVTKAGVSYPAMIKTSDGTLFGQPPASWNQNDQTTNATENILSDMTSPLVDGAPLRDAFILYGDREVWSMLATAGQEVFDYARVFSRGGLIAPNCVAEIDGWHYCFGTTDIYRHNGVEMESLTERKNKAYVFGTLNKKLASRCFVQYSPEFRTLMFAYPSGDISGFPLGSGCNKALVLNLQSGAQSFVDLPNVTSMSIANLNSILQWNTASSVSWATTGSSWSDQTDNFGDNTVGISQTLAGRLTANRLVALDYMDNGSLSFPYLPEMNPPAFVTRTGIDLDEVGANVTDYKVVSRVYPEVRTIRPGISLTLQLGSQLYPQTPVVWDVVNVYNPATDYKIDSRVGGRFLAYKFSMIPAGDFQMSGFDIEVVTGGAR